MHIYTLIGLLLCTAGLASAISAGVAKERSNQRLGLAFTGLFLVGGVACVLLNVFTWSL